MKKLLLAITLLFTGFTYAQQEGKIFVEKGRWALGGGLSLNSTEIENVELESLTEVFHVNVVPKVGYSIADNWLLGLSFMYSYNNNNSSSSTFSGYENIYQSISVAPTIQKYFPVFDNFSFHLQGSVEFGRGWREVSSTSITEDYVQNSYTVAIRPGFSYFLGEHLALEAMTGIVRYSRFNEEKDGMEISKAQNLQLNFGLSNIQIGAVYFF